MNIFKAGERFLYAMVSITAISFVVFTCMAINELFNPPYDFMLVTYLWGSLAFAIVNVCCTLVIREIHRHQESRKNDTD